MYIDICYFDGDHLFGESVMHPILLLATRLGVLLLLEGRSIQRRRAYPDAPPAANSGAFNLGI